jgi:hypothetical protein
MVDPNVEGDRSFYDQVDSVSMNEVTNRHGDTEYTETPHRRRMVTLKTYEVADLVEDVPSDVPPADAASEPGIVPDPGEVTEEISEIPAEEAPKSGDEEVE